MFANISRKFADPQGKALRACKETGMVLLKNVLIFIIIYLNQYKLIL